jgi:hypothetical protein
MAGSGLAMLAMLRKEIGTLLTEQKTSSKFGDGKSVQQKLKLPCSNTVMYLMQGSSVSQQKMAVAKHPWHSWFEKKGATSKKME